MKASGVALSFFALSLLPACAQQAVNGISQNGLKADVSFLASTEMAGRKTASRESRIAANYIASEFLRLGLKPIADDGSYFQNFDLTQAAQDDTHTSLTVRQGSVEKSYQLGHDFDLTWITQTTNPTTVTAPLVFLGHGIHAPEYGYDEFANIDLKGKIVIILPHEPQENNPASPFKGKSHTFHAYDQIKYEAIRKAGAVGILEVIEKNPHRPAPASSAPRQDWFPDAIFSLTDTWDLPVFEITQELANQLLASSGHTIDQLHQQIDADLKPHTFALPQTTVTMTKSYTGRKVVQARNVFGLLEGSDPALKNEYVIVSAHHDHLGTIGDRIQYGADDNSSGEAAMLAVARAFVANGIHPRRSILFASFDAEECGLLGSFHYVSHPLLPLQNAAAILNMDMVGRNEDSPTWKLDPAFTANSINLVGTLYSPDLRRIAEATNQTIHLNLDLKTDAEDREEWLARSDQFAFVSLGVPVILFNGGEHPDYHTENDTWDKLNYPKLEKVSQLIFSIARTVAEDNNRPQYSAK